MLSKLVGMELKDRRICDGDGEEVEMVTLENGGGPEGRLVCIWGCWDLNLGVKEGKRRSLKRR